MPEYTVDTPGTMLFLSASCLIASSLGQGLLLNMNVQYNGPVSMVGISKSSYCNMTCIKHETLSVSL